MEISQKRRTCGNFMQVPRKMLLTVKISIILLFGIVLQVSAAGLAQNVTIRNAKTSCKALFEEVEKQTGIITIVSNDEMDINKEIEVQTGTIELKELYQIILRNTNMEFRMVDDYIVIKPVKKNSSKAVPLKQEQRKYNVKGTVKDETGLPIPGVNIIVQGSGNGTITDHNGNYELTDITPDDYLIYSFIGFNNQSVKTDGKREIHIILLPQLNDLNEVIVTGYQTIKAHESTSAVSTIKKEDLNFAGATSVDQMLEGLVPGMVTINNSGRVGAAPKIRIRGASTIVGSREPVWVIDGLVYENPVKIDPADLNNLDQVNLVGNAISGLNPADIERIDILKDASATAIYGVKAANGVIVVTTKKGKSGKLTAAYSNNFQFSARPNYNRPELMNSQQRVAVSKEIERRGLNYSRFPSPVGYEGLLQELYARKISQDEFDREVRRIEGVNTDWFDLLFENSFSQIHNFSLSGGGNKTTYYFSGGFNDADDVEKSTGLNNYNALMRINTRFNKKLSLDVKLAANHSKRKYNHSSVELYNYAFSTSRAIPVETDGERSFYYKADGAAVNYPITYNILNELDHTGREYTSTGIDFMAGLNYNILPGLKYNATLGINTVNSGSEEYATEDSYYITQLRAYDLSADTPENIRKESVIPFGGELKVGYTDLKSYTLRNQLSLSKKIHDTHTLSVLMGNELRSTRYKGSNSQQFGYLPERGKTFAYINPAYYLNYSRRLETNAPLRITDQINNFVSYYTAITYDINRKYVVNFNLRADGSNNFGQDSNDKFLPVWSASGRWNLAEEDFLYDSDIINLLSLRASYGSQGSVIAEETPNLIVKPGPLNPITQEYTSALQSLPNPNLRWEKTVSYNVGMDFSLFKGKLSGSVEYYQKNSSDLFSLRKVSTVNGVNTVGINSADLKNYGWEMGLNAIAVNTKNWMWSNTFNISRNRNEVTKALLAIKSSNPYNDYLDGTLIKEGNSTDDFYAYSFAGLDENGLPTFNNLTTEDESLLEAEYFNRALTKMGSRIPLVSGGFSNNVRYKNVNLSLSWSYQLGSKRRMPRLYKSNGQTLPNPDQNMASIYLDRWQKAGDENHTDIPSLSSSRLEVINDPSEINAHNRYYGDYLPGRNLWQMYDDSDLRVVSGDYLRLRSVSLSYSLPKKVIAKYGLSGLNIRGQVQNIFVVKDKDLRSLDPEQQSAAAMPVPTTYNLGFDISF